MRIVFISDTHNKLDQMTVPDGDILIHSGDSTNHGSADEIRRFNEQLNRLPHKYKVVIAGNHELLFQQEPERARSLITAAIYLQDESVVIEGIKIYGTPWIPDFKGTAFNLPVGSQRLKLEWDKIPADTDILITHGPPKDALDAIPNGKSVGCPFLRERVSEIKPRIHCFGHVHHSHGTLAVDGTLFINAASNTEQYQPTNAPIVVDVDWEPKPKVS